MSETNLQKLKPVEIDLGFQKLDCAVADGGQVYVTAANVAALFQSAHKRPRDWLNRMGLDLSSLRKQRITGFKNDQLCLTVEQLSDVALQLVIDGNETAKLFLKASFAEAIESRVNAALGIEKTIEERNIIFHYRAAPVTIKERKRVQKMVDGDYKRSKIPGIGRESTIKINLAVFGQKHFKCQRSKYMDKDTQAAIAEIEYQISVLSFQQPCIPIEQHVDTAILKHRNAYGDRYFLPENKEAKVD
jgi:hypothetical protein